MQARCRARHRWARVDICGLRQDLAGRVVETRMSEWPLAQIGPTWLRSASGNCSTSQPDRLDVSPVLLCKLLGGLLQEHPGAPQITTLEAKARGSDAPSERTEPAAARGHQGCACP